MSPRDPLRWLEDEVTDVAEVGPPPEPNGYTDRGPDLCELIDGAELLDRVEEHLTQYVAFPSEHARAAAVLWAAHAHDLDAFDSTPRLALLSPEPGSGKTRVLEVLETLVPGPMHVLSASTAAIFRTIAQERPTLLLDEVDAIFGRRGTGDDNEDLRALLNAGHRKGSTIPRCVGPQHEVKRFAVYAAVALAGLGDLPDTLMSRAVVIRMRRRAPQEHVRPFRARLDVPPGHRLRAELARWALEVADELRQYPTMPEGIDDRPADVWEPLLAVADAAGGDWPARARAACLALAGEGMSREASLGVRLLTDLRAIFGEADKLHTTTILDRLHDLEESPWAELRGKPLDARGLAWRLSQYGIGSRDVRRGDDVRKGYYATDLWDAWQRYLPDPEGSATSATSATPQVTDPEAVADHEGRSATPRASATESESLTSDVAPVADVADLAGTEGEPDPLAFDAELFGGTR